MATVDKYTDSQIRKKLQNIRFRYRISDTVYFNLLKRSSGKCEVCKLSKKLYIDHCHKTGVVRGMICHHCNSALGFLFDDEKIINNLFKYAKKHKKTKGE